MSQPAVPVSQPAECSYGCLNDWGQTMTVYIDTEQWLEQINCLELHIGYFGLGLVLGPTVNFLSKAETVP